MPEEKLNLFEFTTRSMTEPGTCPSKVVRREPLYARFTGVLADRVPHCLLRQAVTPGLPVLVYPPKQLAGGQVGGLKPFIEAMP